MGKLKQQGFNETTGNTDKYQLALLAVNRVKDEKQAKLVLDIYNRFQQMKDWREKSCPWGKATLSYRVNDEAREAGNELQYETNIATSKNNWETRWQRDRDLAMMKTGENAYGSHLPDVSSPVVLGASQAIISQYQDSNLSVMIDPKAGVDEVVAKVAKALVEDLEVNGGVMETKKSKVFPEAVVCGTAFTYNGYFCKKRKVKITKTIEDLMEEAGFDDSVLENESEPQFEPTTGLEIPRDTAIQQYKKKEAELLKQIQADPEKMLLEEKTITDFEGCNIEHVPLEELYFDPSALDINSLTKDCRDVIWRQFVPIQQVIDEYSNSEDLFVIKENVNAKLIISSVEAFGYYSANTDLKAKLDLFNSTQGTELVCLVKYYNKYTDQYIVLANDIVIRKGVLPYNHKQLPFSRYVFMPLPNSFYGVGLGTLLDTTQQSTEMFEALQSHVAEINANLPLTVIGKELSESLKNVLESNEPLKAGQLLEMQEGQSVVPIQTANLGYDFDKALVKLDRNKVIIGGVNPEQNAIPNPNLAVRSAQMSSESTLLTTRGRIQNFENSGYVPAIKQLLSVTKQLEPLNSDEVEDSTKESLENSQVKNQLKKYKQVKLNGVVLNPDDKENEQPKTVELKPEYTNAFEDLEIRMRVEASQLASRQLQAQSLQIALDKTIVIRSNPNLKDDKITNAIFKDYLDKTGMPAKVLNLLQDDQNKEEDELADIQNTIMQSGIPVAPIAGMSESHKSKHQELLIDLFLQQQQLSDELDSLQKQMPMLAQDPVAMQQIDSYIQSAQKKEEDLAKKVKLLNQHLAGDMQSKSDSDLAAVKITTPPQPQMQQAPVAEPPPTTGQEMPMQPMPQA